MKDNCEAYFNEHDYQSDVRIISFLLLLQEEEEKKKKEEEEEEEEVVVLSLIHI